MGATEHAGTAVNQVVEARHVVVMAGMGAPTNRLVLGVEA
jgi:hypothetical protein